MRQESRSVHVTISNVSGAVLDASCTCPASMPGRCNHVAALLLQLNKHCLENGNEPLACTSKPCSWSEGSKKKNPGKLTEMAYPSYKGNKAKLGDFDPRPTRMRTVPLENKNSFIANRKYTSMKTSKTSMWETLLTYKHQDYQVDESREGVLLDKVMELFNNIKENCQSYSTPVHMITGTESQANSLIWKMNRWFRVTASTAKVANSLGNLIRTESPFTDATMRKLYNYTSTDLWGIKCLLHIYVDLFIFVRLKSSADRPHALIHLSHFSRWVIGLENGIKTHFSCFPFVYTWYHCYTIHNSSVLHLQIFVFLPTFRLITFI